MNEPRTPIYLFAGDSLTEGTKGESYVERAAVVLRTGLGVVPGDVVNVGRGCDTLRSLLDRIDRPLEDHNPYWVVLAIGSNDVWLPWVSSQSLGWRFWYAYRRLRWKQTPTTDLDEFAALYRSLLEKARAASQAGVLACTVSPVGERLSSPANRRLAGVNGTIKTVALERGIPVADVWQAFVDELSLLPRTSGYLPREWLLAWYDRRRLETRSPDEIGRRRRLYLTFDGIHLNSRGADVWASTVLRALARAQAAEGLGQGAA
jgi:lysophospholipase L1-like esterase